MRRRIIFGSRTIGTEHILIGMLKEPDCVGNPACCTQWALNIQRLYAGVLAAMGEDQNRGGASGPERKSR